MILSVVTNGKVMKVLKYTYGDDNYKQCERGKRRIAHGTATDDHNDDNSNGKYNSNDGKVIIGCHIRIYFYFKRQDRSLRDS